MSARAESYCRPLKYYTVMEALDLMHKDGRRDACRKILEDNINLFLDVQGSTHNHQAWPGGYYDHVREVMNIAIQLYESLFRMRPLRFELSSALLVLFLHDIEKPWKYERGPDGQLRHSKAFRTKKAQHVFREQKLREYGIALTDEEQNALRYVEGELGDYTNEKRVMNELAAFCHMCDVASARIWYDRPAPHVRMRFRVQSRTLPKEEFFL